MSIIAVLAFAVPADQAPRQQTTIAELLLARTDAGQFARAGDTVTIAGRVTVGTAELGVRRPGFFMADATGGIEVRMRGEFVRAAVGDSVIVRGVLDLSRGRPRIDALGVARLDVPPVALRPLAADLVSVTELGLRAFGRLVSIEAEVAAKRRDEGAVTLLLIAPDGASVPINVSDDPEHPLGLASFAPGDRLRVTGVVSGNADGQRVVEFRIHARDRADVTGVGWTRARTRALTAGTLITLLVLLAVLAYLRNREYAELKRKRRDTSQHQALYAQSTDAILLVDLATLRPVDTNQTTTKFLGVSCEELRSKPIIERFQEADRDSLELALRRTPVTGMWDAPATLTDSAGGLRHVIVRAHPISAGSSRQAVVVLRDVTAETALAEQLRQSQRMDAIGQLAGGVAHDFNNLLTVISSYAEFALANIGDRERVRDDVTQIQRAAESATELTRQLLTFSRKQMVRPQELVLDDMIADLIPMLRRLVGEDFQVDAQLEAPGLVVVADRSQLEQVVVNLVVNARDAMASGGRVTVRTHGSALSGRARLEVQDEGHGIPAEHLPRIFEPFFTTKGVGRGTGLGLATVHGIVAKAGGSISVDSTVGVGTTMKVELPARATRVTESAPRSAVPSAPAGGTVLLAEDDPIVRRAVSRIMRGAGFDVLVASSPGEAIAIASTTTVRIDVLLTDVVMPEMSGSALARRISEIRPNVHTIYMSGYTDDEFVRRGVSRNGVAYLEKPFSNASLIKVLAEGVARARAVDSRN